jgi:hypothetical protein
LCWLNDFQSRDNIKITAVLNEYKELRSDIRILTILELIFLALSILIFVFMLTASTLSDKFILLFISPAMSILFLIIGMGIFAYSTNLGILVSELEDSLNEILEEQIFKRESAVGVFGASSKDFLIKRMSRFWLEISIFGSVIGTAIVIGTLYYNLTKFSLEVGIIAYIIFIFDIAIILTTIILGYRVFRGSWIKIKRK